MPLKLASLIPAAALALAPVIAHADDPAGVKVTITLASADGKLPQPEKMVHALEVVGDGNRQVMIRLDEADKATTTTLELWGRWAPNTEIPQLLRQAEPVLAKAEIAVSTLDPSLKPKITVPEGGDDLPHGKRIVKKVTLEK
jgi:hypothetical protein